jgi:small-conductance mechanosensitive channel
MRGLRTALWILAAFLLLCGPARAFDEALIGQSERAAETFRTELRSIQNELSLPSLTDERLAAHRSSAENVRIRALGELQKLNSPIAEVNQQITQLGPAPESGASEAAAIAAQRKILGDMLNRLQGSRSQLELITLEAEQTAGRIGVLQRDRFVRRIFESGRSILNPLLWYESGIGLTVFAQRAGSLIAAWWSDVGSTANFAWLLLPAAFFLVLAGLLRLFGQLVRRLLDLPQAVEPDDLARLWSVFSTTVGTFLLLALGFVMPLYLAFGLAGILTPRFETLLYPVIDFVISVGVFYAFIRSIAAPRRPEWRLVDLDDSAAARLTVLSTTACAVTAASDSLDKISASLFLPVSYTIGQSAAAAVALLVVIGLMLLTLTGQTAQAEDRPGAKRATYLQWVYTLVPVYWLLLGIAALALIFGYIALGNFIAGQIFNTSVVFAVLFMLHHLADAAVNAAIDPLSRFGRALRRLSGFGERGIERIGLLFRTCVDIILVLAGLPLLFLQWTVTWVDFGSFVNSALFGFKVGNITVSLGSVLLAVGILIAGWALTRIVIRWLDRRILAETRIDKGVQDSVRKAAAYFGYLLAAIFALTAAGLDFTNFALIAGALGVGIGFGLQAIVNNFVSGLILLAERPIRVGDWIVLNAGEGIVKRINVRSTVIETFDNCSIIVPNLQLIAEPVRNWTHDDTLGRFLIAVQVSYNTDEEKVKATLLELARSHPKVLTFPEPSVTLARFGSLGIEYELRGNVADIFEAGQVASDIRFSLLKAFRKKGITIPQASALAVAR